MKHILIIGAGSVGLSMGASLRSQGMEITFLAGEHTKKAIDDNGIKRTGLFGEIAVAAGDVAAVSSLSELAGRSIDDALVCTKTTANETVAAALSGCRGCLSENAKIVILQNGWGNDEPFRRYFSEDQIYQARVITGFVRTAPNVSSITVHTAPILFGSLYGKDTVCMEPLARAINASGIPAETTGQLSEALWAKMLYNTTLNPLGAILHVPYGKLADTASSRQIMNRLIDETFLVMRHCGYRSFWETPDAYREEFYGKLVPDTRAHRSSTLQDIEKKQKTEIETLNGCIVRLARQHGLSVPTHRMLCELIAALEDNYV
ncbi:MAG: 2-dehydropantoate 2-reductase [Lachnospiraceae bacterium]|nr:2-dehydropantoate 2-reductase [Lachnospiraceae bacterium]